MKPEDEVSIYRWSAALEEEARQGVKGRAIAWRSASGSQGVQEPRRSRPMGSAVGKGKGEC